MGFLEGNDDEVGGIVKEITFGYFVNNLMDIFFVFFEELHQKAKMEVSVNQPHLSPHSITQYPFIILSTHWLGKHVWLTKETYNV